MLRFHHALVRFLSKTLSLAVRPDRVLIHHGPLLLGQSFRNSRFPTPGRAREHQARLFLSSSSFFSLRRTTAAHSPRADTFAQLKPVPKHLRVVWAISRGEKRKHDPVACKVVVHDHRPFFTFDFLPNALDVFKVFLFPLFEWGKHPHAKFLFQHFHLVHILSYFGNSDVVRIDIFRVVWKPRAVVKIRSAERSRPSSFLSFSFEEELFQLWKFLARFLHMICSSINEILPTR